MWYYEDLLRKNYRTFVQSLQELAQDNQTPVRNKVLNSISTLLSEFPEQEKVGRWMWAAPPTYGWGLRPFRCTDLIHSFTSSQTLLAMLVNRLGDAERKIASKTGHLLRELLKSHPQMKMVVVKEVRATKRKGATRERRSPA
jgi:ribosome biogenesis protein MAK21